METAGFQETFLSSQVRSILHAPNLPVMRRTVADDHSHQSGVFDG